jgi:hypothetical protein
MNETITNDLEMFISLLVISQYPWYSLAVHDSTDLDDFFVLKTYFGPKSQVLLRTNMFTGFTFTYFNWISGKDSNNYYCIWAVIF